MRYLFLKEGSLDKLIAFKELNLEPIDFKTLFNWIYQLTDALEYIHNTAKLVHRDIKTAYESKALFSLF